MLVPVDEPFRLSPSEFENALTDAYAMFEKMEFPSNSHLAPLSRKDSQKRLASGGTDHGRSLESICHIYLEGHTIRKRGPVRLAG